MLINGAGPFNVRERRERATYRGEYVDTIVDLVGERRRVRVLANDSGTRGSGQPSVFEIDPEGNPQSDSDPVERVTLPGTITADVTVRDYLDEIR